MVDTVKISDDVEAVHDNKKAYNAVAKTKSVVWKFFQKNMDKSVKFMCYAKLQYYGETLESTYDENILAIIRSILLRKHKQRKLDVFAKKCSCSTERAGAISKKIKGMNIKI